MGRVRLALLARVFAALVLAVATHSAALAQTQADLTVPEPASVSLDAATTSLVAIDFLQSTCASNPLCVNTLPAMANALSTARTANAHVIYSVHLAPDNNIVPEVAPLLAEQVFAAIPGDKFFDSNLDYLLRQTGTTTVVLSGVSSNSGVMYTTAAAIQRGYTVVIATDAIAAANELSTTVALWQLLHGPGANPQNVPLQPKAVTLSRSDLITYK
ncbi:MAG TPA: isochorismatase family protein [Chloroflexota bacterium]|nr:isochorismatase family protein [Chloroflexota bacterium]